MLVEHRSQLVESSRGPGLDGADRDLESVRNFTTCKSSKIGKLQDFALIVGQRGEVCVELVSVDERRQIDAKVLMAVRRGLLSDFAPFGCCPKAIETARSESHENPGTYGAAVWIVRMRMAPNLQKDVVNEIFGRWGAPEHAHGSREHQALISVVKGRERLGCTTRGLLDQDDVVERRPVGANLIRHRTYDATAFAPRGQRRIDVCELRDP